MSVVRFIDTSIMSNLLGIPGKCQNYDKVWEEFKTAIHDKDTMILPVATVIETGNHIAHQSDGNVRRKLALKFSEYLLRTAKGEAPWFLYGNGLTTDDLIYIAEKFPEYATRAIGTGDLSIITQFNDYVNTIPAGTVMIWSTDAHLSSLVVDDASQTRLQRH